MHRRCEMIGFCCIMAALVCISAPAYAQTRTITGIVYGNYEIETDDGEIYVVVADDRGDELAALDGTRVRVTGLVDEIDGSYGITVIRFSVLEDEVPQEEASEENPEGDQEESLEAEAPADEPKE